MGMRRFFTISTLLLTAGLTACATSPDTGDDERYARRGPPQCSEQDLSAFNMNIRTCVQPFGPTTLPEEARFRNPYVVTVVNTPAGTFSNPTAWTVEVRRDGELIVERAFTETEAAIERESSFVEFRSAVPLTEEGELEPGTYEIRYRDEQGEDIGTTTIEVPPADGEAPADEEVDVPPEPEINTPSGTMGN
ncbi:hypothetical protein FIV42_06530 [Persicimonas caeni]|uniref:Lipoprotein n=1 Tax=Persicimonas caeni TaxID=2292766 RepID=A0A4Y6PQ50_PERCE|nr:hypothetical protein [Persicimonas caeni]QDG50400.1 hypothetical protein FIV42_06530 [Persicimonas caeni]QED31621.1 hypothetical protein FRD00_06525 [Persicimonas caeni]